MKLADLSMGHRGLALLVVTAAVGLVLAVHGWSGRHAGVAPGGLAGGRTAPAPRAHHSPPAAALGPSSSPSATPGSAAPAPTATASTGPLLSSQSFAPYSYRVWPGTPDAAARSALTGLSVSVHHQGTGISVAAGVAGQPGTARFYAHGAGVYVVEASLGDDSGNADYNMGDDGLVVTNAQGRILQ